MKRTVDLFTRQKNIFAHIEIFTKSIYGGVGVKIKSGVSFQNLKWDSPIYSEPQKNLPE